MRSKGYTLIEVLVSMVIFSILMTLAVSSYRYFFTATGSKANSAYDLSLLTKRKVINTSLRGIQAYYYQGADGKSKLFFKGERSSFSFITNTPSYISEPLAIASFFLLQSGTLLAYCETPLGSIALLDYRFKPANCPDYQTYLTAEEIQFSYFTWKDVFELDNYYSEMLNVAVKPKPLWRQQYDSAETIILPLYVKITTKNGEPLLPRELFFELPQEIPHTKGDKNAL